MAITHKQLQDVFEFDKINSSAYGIKSYKTFKSGVEVFAKKNELEVRIPGTQENEVHSLEHLSLDDLKSMLPKWINSAIYMQSVTIWKWGLLGRQVAFAPLGLHKSQKKRPWPSKACARMEEP